MSVRPSVLCPLDCSDRSVAALRYATAIAEHFVTRLIVLSVRPSGDRDSDPEVARERHERSLAAFIEQACGVELQGPMCELDIAYGTPSVEILRVARERTCDLIVMGAGAYAPRAGRTTAAALAAATRPVLLIPTAIPGAVRSEDIRRQLRAIVAPGGHFSDYLTAIIGLASV